MNKVMVELFKKGEQNWNDKDKAVFAFHSAPNLIKKMEALKELVKYK